ncbi:hypothetical protein C7402_12717 [Paraburkholderia unamae]|uniref:Uncharacterized protein n=1 Tax=Paraburkholderia unamae TaxID=219649 RepID=A0ABX5KA15_9BURK|nr:hypothetical protein C7402_12717 [Paraburkholderia unamae]RAR52090.1 hypothetical protein C7401_13484 [Paraburkholderia unamae]
MKPGRTARLIMQNGPHIIASRFCFAACFV